MAKAKPAPAFDPTTTYISIEGAAAKAMAVTDSFWPDVMAGKRKVGDWLMTAFPQDKDWDVWERHPKGEEILVMLKGALTLVIDDGTSLREVALNEGESTIVPRNTWHTGKLRKAGTLLALTFGEGTDHRPL